MSSKTKGVVVYLLLAFGLAWAFWAIPLLKGLSPRSPVFQLACLPGGLAPAVAALVVRRWITREGFADAGLRLNLRAWRYYLFAWLSPFFIAGVIVALAAAFRISQPDFSFERALKIVTPETDLSASLPPMIRLLLPLLMMVQAILVTPLLWGEEFGWRSYLQIRLCAERPLWAAVATGLIWGVWHYPLVFAGYQFPDHPRLGLLVFPVGTVLVSIIFGWLRLRTGSVWPVSLAHASTNAIGASLTVLLFMGGPHWIWVCYLGVLGWIPLGAICAWIILSGQLRPATEDQA